MAVDDTVTLAKNEIKEYFSPEKKPLETDTDIGFFGDVIGKCPLCGSDVKRGKFAYGCAGYKAGCKFTIWTTLCGRVVSAANARLLLEDGRSSKIQGFVSKKGNIFDAHLKIVDGKCVFDFDDTPTVQ